MAGHVACQQQSGSDMVVPNTTYRKFKYIIINAGQEEMSTLQIMNQQKKLLVKQN